MSKNSLEQSLYNAVVCGGVKEFSAFLEELYSSEVIFPIRNPETIVVVGAGSTLKSMGAVYITDSSTTLLPIFSSIQAFENWSADNQIPYKQLPFAKIISLVQENDWIYLNPSSEEGKEFTPFEISLLRSGPEAFPELIRTWIDEQIPENEVRKIEHQSTPKLRGVVYALAENFPQIETVFLGELVTYAAREEKSVIVGIAQRDIENSALANLVSEIKTLMASELPETTGVIVNTNLLQSPQDMHLFENLTPCYIRQEPVFSSPEQ